MYKRDEWLREKRRRCEERMDTLFAPTYDQDWGYINTTHREMFSQFLALCAPGETILDAACGTGKYWQIILDAGFAMCGVDQSAEMLRAAHAKYPAVPIEKRGLQDVTYNRIVGGVVCIDAMENICPEDWLMVLGNLYRALKPGAPLYVTVELAAPEEVTAAYTAGQVLGLPLVPGEWAHEGSYHYYPELEQVRTWLSDALLPIRSEVQGDGYQHFIAIRG